jgi:hypothetical protein
MKKNAPLAPSLSLFPKIAINEEEVMQITLYVVVSPLLRWLRDEGQVILLGYAAQLPEKEESERPEVSELVLGVDVENDFLRRRFTRSAGLRRVQ